METTRRTGVRDSAADLTGSRLLRSGVTAAAVAAVVNLALMTASFEALAVPSSFGLLEFWHVLVTTLGVGFVATLVYATVDQFAETERPDRLFVRVAAVALVLSFLPFAFSVPGRPGATLEAMVVLGSMHLTTAVVVVSVLVYWTRPEEA